MKKAILLICFACFLAACGVEPEPTPTVIPTLTVQPTATITPVPTVTSVPTPYPTPLPNLVHIAEGGYYFDIPENYQVDYQGAFTYLADQNFEVFATMAGFLAPVPYESSKELLITFMTELSSREGVSFGIGELYDYTVDGVIGTGADLTGEVETGLVEGFVVGVIVNPSHFFFILVISSDHDNWIVQDRPVFESLLASIQFDSSSVLPKDTCEVAADETYGYTKENPVRVGGDWLQGPEREHAYLNTIKGPNGEFVEYIRIDAVSFGETTLDVYQLTYAGRSEPFVVYIDQSTYEDLMAPVGFTCPGDFPITAP